MVFQPILRYLIVAISFAVMLFSFVNPVPAQLTIDADSQYAYAQSRLDSRAFDEAIIEAYVEEIQLQGEWC